MAYIEVDVDLYEFDTDDLISELKCRAKSDNTIALQLIEIVKQKESDDKKFQILKAMTGLNDRHAGSDLLESIKEFLKKVE